MRSAHGKLVRGVLMATVGAAAIACSAPAAAQLRDYNVPAESASKAIATLARQGNVQILLPGRTAKGIRTKAVTGSMSIEDALATMLAGTGLHAQKSGAQTWIIVPLGVAHADEATQTREGQVSPSAGGSGDAATNNDIIVTGSRIRGAPPASPLIVVTQTDMQNAGQNDLGEVVRSIPQNFEGGQNPGAGSRSALGSSSGDGASTLNLRGIGNDATLTLLNGHRLATNRGSGVDITAIPIAGVDRLEVLTDGASALYGSDAVGGVANVITRKNYSGLTTTALYGGSTDGGYEQQQYSATGGATWTSGGIIAAINYRKNSAITADQRSYTATMNPETTLFPKQERLNLFASARQDFGPGVRFAVDILYSDSNIESRQPFGAGTLLSSGGVATPTVRTFLIAPSLDIDLGRSWQLSSYATYGSDISRNNTKSYSGATTNITTDCYCNTSSSAEVSVEGPLLRLPAGNIRLATGGGYRSNRTNTSQLTNGVLSGVAFSEKDSIYYGFGELNVPMVGPNQQVPLIYSLSASAAVRYESYQRLGSVATPKFGVIYGMTPSLTFKGSWGKSFKASTFFQRYARNQVILRSTASYGTLYPTGTTYLYISGGNPDLKPERATSLSLSAEYRPPSVPGLRVEANYYHIKFKDRVISPIPSSAGLLTNPIYQDLINPNPTTAQIVATVAQASPSLVLSGVPAYDPTKVVAIADGRSVNAAEQIIDGFDVSASYRFSLSPVDKITVSTSSTYLNISQRRIAGEPSLAVTGNFYQPRFFKSRTGGTWQHGPLTFSAYVNFMGGAKYRAVTPLIDIDPNTSVDLVTRWTLPRPLNATLALNVINAFNSKPTVVPGLLYESSYDASVYSATGRAISVSITKSW